MTQTTLQNADDVVAFLKAQHEQVKVLLGDVLDNSGEAREAAFVELRRLLAVHETAEEEVVHPRAKRTIDHGDSIVDARLKEENAGKQALAELEKLDVDSPEFTEQFQQLRSDVLEHAEAEEQQEFSRLSGELEPGQLARMRRAVELAEKTAPTRPHAGVESGAANLAVGPFASMIDRARDALST
jgi:hemerythrin superfamily protein